MNDIDEETLKKFNALHKDEMDNFRRALSGFHDFSLLIKLNYFDLLNLYCRSISHCKSTDTLDEYMNFVKDLRKKYNE